MRQRRSRDRIDHPKPGIVEPPASGRDRDALTQRTALRTGQLADAITALPTPQ